MNVIAILSHPQECGDDSLRLVSCADGQVIFELNLTPEEDPTECIVKLNEHSERGVFYDECVRQRFEVGYQSDDFTSLFGVYLDKELTKDLWRNRDAFWEKYEDDVLTIVEVHDEGVTYITDSEFSKGKPVHLWKYIVAQADREYEDIYHPERDSVYQEILNRLGIECPIEDRYDETSLAAKIADAMGYKLLNVIYG